MAKKKVIRITIKLPSGVFASEELENVATAAATKAVEEHTKKFSTLRELALKLNRAGIVITPEELLERSTPAKSGPRQAKALKVPAPDSGPKRVVLTDGQRAAVIEALRNGEKTRVLSEKYGVSPATIANIKRDNGLTKPRA